MNDFFVEKNILQQKFLVYKYPKNMKSHCSNYCVMQREAPEANDWPQ